MAVSNDIPLAFESGRKAGLAGGACMPPALPPASKRAWQDGWSQGAYEKTQVKGGLN